MNKVFLRPRARLVRAELLALGLCLALVALTFAAQAADAPPRAKAQAEAASDAASARQIAERTRALERARAAVVGVQAVAVEDAGSVATLGLEREGSGVVIGADGLVLTIGYLILEAEHVDIVLDSERVVPARVVAYDLATGFGLLQALAPLDTEPAPLGDSTKASAEDPLLVVSGGEDGAMSLAKIVSRRAFSGYWEYHIDGALFTAPARPDHSGAALFNADGELIGIGSLLVGDAMGNGIGLRGNMFVPVNLLKPILGELRANGASRGSSRAWLGVNCVEHEGQIRVLRLTGSGPAEDAGVHVGDQIVAVDGVEVNSLETFYKTLWQRDPERDVILGIRRGGVPQTLRVHSVDRMKTLRHPEGV
jgi:S1-C subfamily serine protease